jgi:hypothetical protein
MGDHDRHTTNGRRWLRDRSRNRLYMGRGQYMPRSPFSLEIITTIGASQKACECTESESMEIKAVTLDAIAKSRELMAEIDAVLAKR